MKKLLFGSFVVFMGIGTAINSYAVEHTFSELETIFSRANDISNGSIKEILGKTYVCQEVFDDNSQGVEYFRLDKEGGLYHESYRHSLLKQKRSGTLRGTNSTGNLKVKLTDGNDVVVKNVHTYMRRIVSYKLCKADTARLGTTVSKGIELPTKMDILYASMDEQGNIYTIARDVEKEKKLQKRSNGRNIDKEIYSLAVRDKDGVLISEMNLGDFYSNLAIDGFIAHSSLMTKDNGVYLIQPTYDPSDRYSKNALILLNKDLKNSTIEQRFAYYLRPNASGELVNIESHITGAIGTDGLIEEVGLVDGKFRKAVEYRLNNGHTMVLNDYDQAAWNYEISDISPNADGSFYVLFNDQTEDKRGIASIYLYDKNGVLKNSWGLKAKDNNAAILELDHFHAQSDPRLQIVGKTLITARKNAVYTYELE